MWNVYLPTSSHGYNLKQGQFLRGVLTSLNLEFSVSQTGCNNKNQSLSYYLPTAGGRILRVITFPSYQTIVKFKYWIHYLTPHAFSYGISSQWKANLSIHSVILFSRIQIMVFSPRGVMVKAMDCRIVVSELGLRTRYYVHFLTNTLGKVGDLNRGWPECFFSITTTPTCGEGRYYFSWIAPLYLWYSPYNAECSARRHQVPFFESLVWLDLGLNPGISDH